MSTDTGNQAHIDWEEIIVRLTAFTRSWTRGKPWFRGEKTTTFLMGKEVEDYVFAAIGKYLEEPEKFDPDKGELLEYLKYNLVRSFVANDLRKKENNQTDVFLRMMMMTMKAGHHIPKECFLTQRYYSQTILITMLLKNLLKKKFKAMLIQKIFSWAYIPMV